MPKIDWNTARIEYINTPTVSLQTIADKYEISHASVGERAKKERWLDQRLTKQIKLAQKLENQTEIDIVKEKAKMMREARFVAGKGLAGITAHFPRNTREAKELWEAGSNVKMKVLGIDKGNVNINNLNQQNNFMGWDQFMDSDMQDDKTRISTDTPTEAR